MIKESCRGAPGQAGPGRAGAAAGPGPQPGRPQADTAMRRPRTSAILTAMNTDSHRIPERPTLDGLEDKWTQRWSKERVVQL